MVGPVDAMPLIARARELYPAATHLAVEGNAFVLVAMDAAPTFTQATAYMRRVLTRYFVDRFDTIPSKAAYIVLFSSYDTFDKYSRQHYGIGGTENLGGYDRDRREIIVDVSAGEPSLGSIGHELAHVILDEDFVLAPRWFNECVATVFEQPRWDEDGSLHGAKVGRRYKLLTDALASPSMAPLARFDTLFGMTDAEFLGFDPTVGVEATKKDPRLMKAARARNLLHHAVARYACLWLDDLDPPKLTAFYRAWREDYATDRTGKATFERIVGEPPEAVQARWAAWVKTPSDRAALNP